MADQLPGPDGQDIISTPEVCQTGAALYKALQSGEWDHKVLQVIQIIAKHEGRDPQLFDRWHFSDKGSNHEGNPAALEYAAEVREQALQNPDLARRLITYMKYFTRVQEGPTRFSRSFEGDTYDRAEAFEEANRATIPASAWDELLEMIKEPGSDEIPWTDGGVNRSIRTQLEEVTIGRGASGQTILDMLEHLGPEQEDKWRGTPDDGLSRVDRTNLQRLRSCDELTQYMIAHHIDLAAALNVLTKYHGKRIMEEQLHGRFCKHVLAGKGPKQLTELTNRELVALFKTTGDALELWDGADLEGDSTPGKYTHAFYAAINVLQQGRGRYISFPAENIAEGAIVKDPNEQQAILENALHDAGIVPRVLTEIIRAYFGDKTITKGEANQLRHYTEYLAGQVYGVDETNGSFSPVYVAIESLETKI